MDAEILIVAEHREGKLDSRARDLVSWTTPLAREQRWRLGALLLGSDLKEVASELSTLGIDTVFVLDDPRLQSYNPDIYLDALKDIVRQAKPRVVVVDHSYFGIEIAGSIATELNTPCISNCQTIEVKDGEFLVTRWMFG